MDSKFIARCDKELAVNTKEKGEWSAWKPTRKELCQELAWHMAKLHHSIIEGHTKSIQEFSADVANLCEKAFTMAGLPANQRKPEYDFYGDFAGGKDRWLFEMGKKKEPQS